jgi:RNA polymerase-binding transcription factor DksA
VELNAARERLIDEKKRLSEATNGLADELDLDESQQSSTGELNTYDQHPADAASDTFEREKDSAILTTLKGRGAEIDAALQRLEDGSYGNCEACGEPIGDDRLEAFPAARFCMEHQAQQEAQISGQ